MPNIPVSWGDFFDRLSILEIKRDMITREPAHTNILRELSSLQAAEIPALDAETALLIVRLREINRELWTLEEGVRTNEAEGRFGAEFIAMARSVYRTNDMRHAVKRKIDELLQSPLVEEKSYPQY